ncbi:MAG: acyltransferase family protein [Desulfobulbaceae bacterium]|nr:acyltransferase family protein [Desulfobulbaceae bacterium]
MTTKYRADIDGLRAVAVLAVVCFHAFPAVLKGGFVGVDIFFVISGFLISCILLANLQEGTFSYKEFYLRRILRIFPALIVVLSFCYVMGWFVLLPKEFQQLGKHMVGGAIFVSNLFFWQEAGYFDTSSETKPLLHLWSLGVEEQFYIVWPCLLLLAWKKRTNLLKMATFFIVVSFPVNVYALHIDDAVQAFYSPVARFWELLLGGLLAYIQLYTIPVEQYATQRINNLCNKVSSGSLPILNPVTLQNWFSILGAFLIFSAMIFVDRNHTFPGWWALLPTVGAFLVILAGPRAVVNRLILSARPMVWVGVISYPLYLWHWPLLSFSTIMENKTPSFAIKATAVTLAFILAWLTYLFVERPIRFGKRSKKKTSLLVLCMILLTGLGCVAFLKANVRSSTLTKGMVDQIEKLRFDLHFAKWSPCPNNKATWSCKMLNPAKPAEIALIGDSHSVHLASGLAGLDTVLNHNIISRNMNGCMPFFELELPEKTYYSCDGFIDNALEEAINSDSIKMIMLSGYAMWRIERFDPEHPEAGSGSEAQKNADIMKMALHETLSSLVDSGKKIIFFVDIPELDFEPSECLDIRPVYMVGHTVKDPCAIPRPTFDQRSTLYHQIVQDAQKEFPTVKFINLYDYLCDQDFCYAFKDGKALYTGRDHLSVDGSRYVASKMEKELEF